MNPLSSSPQITDETLSAYLDGAVTIEERNLIDRALAHDAELLWRLESLRQTVHYLSTLPAIKAKRSFSIEAILAAEAAGEHQHAPVTRQAAARADAKIQTQQGTTRDEQASVWQRFLDFWSSGSLALRNGAMVAAALFLVVTVSTQTLPGGSSAAQQFAMSDAVMEAPADAPAAAEIGTEAMPDEVAVSEETASEEAVAAEGSAEAAPEEMPAPQMATRAMEPSASAVMAQPAAEAGDAVTDGSAQEDVAPANMSEDTAAAPAGTDEASANAVMSAASAPEAPQSAMGIGSAADASQMPDMGDPALGGMGGGPGMGVGEDGALGGAMPPQFAPEAPMQGGPAITGLDQAQAEAMREMPPAPQAAAVTESADVAETEAAEESLAEESAGDEVVAASSALEAAAVEAPVPAEAATAASATAEAPAAIASADMPGTETGANTDAAQVAPSEQPLTVSSSASASLREGVQAQEATPAASTSAANAATATTTLAARMPWLLYAEIVLGALTVLLAISWLLSRRQRAQ